MFIKVNLFYPSPLFLQNAKVHILDTEGYETTFGPKSQRKRPNLIAGDMQELLQNAEASAETYDQEKDRDLVTEDSGVRYKNRNHLIFLSLLKKKKSFFIYGFCPIKEIFSTFLSK